MRKYLALIKSNIYFSVKDTLITLTAFSITTGVCLLIHLIEDADICVVLLYLLSVVIVSRVTKGYFYGFIDSIVSVLGINFVFMDPYWEFCLSKPTYPLAFFTMMVVTLIISTLTKRIALSEKRRYEIQAEQLRANLLRAMSHDLRTPLTSISGAASVIISHPQMQPDQRNQMLQDIVDDTEWLIRMVENLLSITRVSTQPTQLKKTVEVAEEVLGGAISKFRKHFPDMPVEVQLPDDVLLAPMDPMLIEQVITNLLQNVIYHAQSATKIWINLSQEKEKVCFCIRDNGIGIAPERLPTLFSSYQGAWERQADSDRNMGIGLSVCKAIVDAHGGEIHACNHKEGGACFVFSLPAAEQTIQMPAE